MTAIVQSLFEPKPSPVHRVPYYQIANGIEWVAIKALFSPVSYFEVSERVEEGDTLWVNRIIIGSKGQLYCFDRVHVHQLQRKNGTIVVEFDGYVNRGVSFYTPGERPNRQLYRCENNDELLQLVDAKGSTLRGFR